MKYLLDTCCLSELFKKAPDTGVVEWLSRQSMADLFLSVVTVGEIQKGIFRLPQSQKSELLQRQLNQFMEIYADRIVPLNRDTLLDWGLLCARAESKGHSLPVLDSLIAATAFALKMEVVTRNVKDMERCGAKIVNPWKA